MTDYVRSNDGTRIAYETVGTGSPAILVDGAMCHRSMRPLASLLSTNFWCVPMTVEGEAKVATLHLTPSSAKLKIWKP